MNAGDILKYGDAFFMATVDDLPEADWLTPNVCGVWSVKDIVAHLASSELILVELLSDFLGEAGPRPTLESLMTEGPEGFNDVQVAHRQHMTVAETLAEYQAGYAKGMTLIARIPAARCAEVGTIPAYGPEYSLDDLIVYSYYGHKREHGAQVAVFRDQLKQR
jgi:hypothetical protein